MILIGHFLGQNEPAVSPTLITAFSQYWSGVDLFFVLSGFVIFLALDRLRERAAGWSFFKSYFAGRAFRILPVYILLLLAYFYIPFNNRLMNSELFTSSVPGYVYLYFGQTWYMVSHHERGAGFVFVSWSLCAEVFFYLVSFVLVCLVPKRHLIKAMIGMALASFILRIYTAVIEGNLSAAYLLPTCRLDGFMLGGVVAVLYAGDRLSWVNYRILNRILLLFFCAFAAFSAEYQYLSSRFSIVFLYAFYAVFYSMVLLRLTNGNYAMLSRGPLKYIGVVSYFVYLFHVPVVFWMRNAIGDRNVALNFLATVSMVVGGATISWYAMERPMIERGKSLIRGSVHPAGSTA